MSQEILIVGCGDLGTTLGKTLMARGYQVIGLRRSKTLLPEGIRTITCDVTNPSSLASALADTRPAIAVYCVAADAQTDAAYKSQYVEGLQNILNALVPGDTPPHVFFVSSTRPYGQETHALLDETTPARPADFGGERLLEAETLLAASPFPSTVLRLSGIYGPGRHRLMSLAQQPHEWPQRNSWTNRIHRDDAAAFIAFLVARALAGENLAESYIVTDSAPAPQHEVLRWIARETGQDDLPASPAVSGGKRLSNARMLGTGFHLRYPTYREGYKHELHASQREGNRP